MCERRYKLGLNRRQAMRLPPSVDDDVSEDRLARAIDIDVETLDLAALGFRHAEGGLTPGQPYAPAHLLKLDLYGYLNRIRSSRRLQAEAERNLEIIWLLEGLRPVYRTIAEFRRTNAKALKAANREFVLLCRELDLVGGEHLGIDGSHFNANAGDASVKTLTQLEREHARYHQELDRADTREDAEAAPTGAVSAKLDELTARQAAKAARIAALKDTGETQISRTDTDARRLKKHGKSTVGYNVRSVVDDKHKLIVVAEATSAGNDVGQLAPMAEAAKSALGIKEAEVFADAGYWTEDDIAACERAGLLPYVPIPDTERAVRDAGRLPASAFHDLPGPNVHICPGGEILHPYGEVARNGKTLKRYAARAGRCEGCPLAKRCLPEKTPYRQIYRSELADVVEGHRARAALCEHPFGTLKRWMGRDHFLVRGLEKVQGELALLVHCDNFRRVSSILGLDGFRAACEARRRSGGRPTRSVIFQRLQLMRTPARAPRAPVRLAAPIRHRRRRGAFAVPPAAPASA
ncbi:MULTISPECIES: IS1182 family transposase [unclassified Thiocapsa]|uniref:IS1182 family transposase n=1 Tax=unclassified Thiocapsa TaxID=2641286 RepID=UPI0035AF7438